MKRMGRPLIPPALLINGIISLSLISIFPFSLLPVLTQTINFLAVCIVHFYIIADGLLVMVGQKMACVVTP